MPHEPSSESVSAKTAAFEQAWQEVHLAHEAFVKAEVRERSARLGELFTALSPLLEQAIHQVALRHFLLLPLEMALARLFARTIRRGQLPQSRLMYQLWVESSLLQALADPSDALGSTNGAPGEPSGELQVRFHRLRQADRALLFLYLVEGCSVQEVVQFSGIPQTKVVADLRRVWRLLQRGGSVPFPESWHYPEFAQEGLVAEGD